MRLEGLLIRAVCAAFLAASAALPVAAQNATWLLAPGNNDFNDAANWSSGAVPGPGNTASFATSTTRNLILNAFATVGGITFNAGAGAYSLFTNGSALDFDGAGIVINPGSSFELNNDGFVSFRNSSSAGAARINNNFGGGFVLFQDDSNAGAATIVNDFSFMQFQDRASAGSASIFNGQTGLLQFVGDSTLGSARLDNSGILSFGDDATAGTGVIINSINGQVVFQDSASAGNATIVNKEVGFFGGLLFADDSTAANATIHTMGGALTAFLINADGGMAAFEADAGAMVDFSGSFGPNNDGVVNAGSIAGAGTYIIAFGQTLSVGGNGRSTEVSGVLADGCGCGPIGGSLNKVGGGTLTLSGMNTITGLVQVLGGRLIVNGSTTSTIGTIVADGAVLGGNGFVSSVVVAGGGMLAPGNSVGTLTVNGNLGFADGAFFDVEVSTAADRVTVVPSAIPPLPGFAILDGTVRATYLPTGSLQRRYTILSAQGGTTGAFDGVTSSAPGIVATLAYDGFNVYLDSSVALTGIPGLTDNQRAVAGAIDRYFAAHGTVPLGLAVLDAAGLTLASGEIATAAAGAGFHSAELFLGQMSDPFVTGAGGTGAAPEGDMSSAYAPLAYSAEPANLSSPGALAALGAEVAASSDAANAALAMASAHAADPVDAAFAARWTLWGAAYGGVARIGGDPVVVGSADLTTRNWGIASGFDRSFGDGRVGFALGGAGSTFALTNGLGAGNAGIFNAGVYGSHSFGNAYVSAAAAFAWNSVRTTRFAGGDTLTANFNAHTLSGRVEAGYRFGSSSAIIPYAALQGVNYTLPAYAETSALGGPFALAYQRQSQFAARTELGARFEHVMPLDNAVVKLSGRAAWAWNASNQRAITAAFQALPGQNFTVNGARPARHAALIDLGVEAAFDNGLAARLSFNGEFARNLSSYGVSAKLSYRW